jgi:hypothetical protein
VDGEAEHPSIRAGLLESGWRPHRRIGRTLTFEDAGQAGRQLTVISAGVVFGQHISEKMIACGFLPCVILILIRKINPVSRLAVKHGSGGALDETGGEGAMSPPRLAAVCGTVVLAGWVAGGLVWFVSSGMENTGAPTEGGRATPVTAGAEPVDAPHPTAMGEGGRSRAEVGIVDAALPGPRPMPRPETPSVQVASASMPDPVQGYTKAAVGSVETPDECFMIEICIDRYLWSVYQRAPKVDTIKVPERIKATVKKKGKTRTVIKTVIKLVDEDFTWKDPKAAQKAGMSLMEYVIGGMDRSFKLKLYHALRALDDAELSPGMTSGFRDDYRQSLASGNRAATDSSYHGGSRRGGYGHGLAADLVSVKGETRAQRWSSSENLWKWVDAHGKEFGIGRPYLDRDAPHVAPIDGKEYADHRGGAKARLAGLETNRRHRVAGHNDHSVTKRARTARSSRARSI